MESHCFDNLFTKPRPHILEMICLSLEFESFKNCLKVSNSWSGVLTNKVFQAKVKLVFSDDILEEELALRKMSLEGDAHGVRKILSSGLVNVDFDGDVKLRYDTPLKLATSRGHHEIVRLLINAGANVNWCDTTAYGEGCLLERLCPLITAANLNKIEIIKLLIDAGACIDQADSMGRAPLHYASFSGCVEAVNLLLDNGADINSADEYGTTSLIMAIMIVRPDNARIAKLLVERGADLEKADEYGETPLIKAVRYNRPEIVKLLLDNGASLTHDAGDGTPLGLAFENFNEWGESHAEVFRLISEVFRLISTDWMTKIG